MYAIIDIETTGTKAFQDKIIEIAIITFDGKQVLNVFTSLVNPERRLPPFITSLTGIDDDMLMQAPRFYEIAKTIIELTQDKILVAHNADFDYAFLKNEFRNLGYAFQRKTLCTLRLTKKIIPNLTSYSLQNICVQLKISLENHHRAYSDAAATKDLLGILLEKNQTQVDKKVFKQVIQHPTLPPNMSWEAVEVLPEAVGVYYLLDENKEIIYVGKSINIRKRILSHFSGPYENSKSLNFKHNIHSIDYVITGSELVALLFESHEIKRLQPHFNRKQRRSVYPYGIFERIDGQGYKHLYIDKIKNEKQHPLVGVDSWRGAQKILHQKAQKFGLCLKLCDLYRHAGACFNYHIKLCQGACIQQEEPILYNQRVDEAIDSVVLYKKQSFLMVDMGRNLGEKSIISIENGRYMGWGYIDSSLLALEPAALKPYIQFYQDNKDVQDIIREYLRQNLGLQIIYY